MSLCVAICVCVSLCMLLCVLGENSVFLHSTDNPVTVPRMNPAFSLVESTNTQFQYETQEKLTGQLEREYGQVRPLLWTGDEYSMGLGRV